MVYNVCTGFQGTMANTHVSLMCNNQKNKNKWRLGLFLICTCVLTHPQSIGTSFNACIPCMYFHIFDSQYVRGTRLWCSLGMFSLILLPGFEAWGFSFLWSHCFPPPPPPPSKLWNKSWEMRGPPSPSPLLISRCANPRSTQEQTLCTAKVLGRGIINYGR